MRWLLISLLLLAACTEVSMEQEPQEDISVATFAGGCFWCMEPPFEKLDGVHSVISGYAGGTVENPTYKEVSSGSTGHREAIQVHFDESKVTYKELLDVFWRQIDPTDEDGSFVDRGFQYSSAIYAHDDEQKKLADVSLNLVQERFTNPVVTVIEPFTNFYPAEDYHQDYYKQSSIRYKFYRSRSGRDDFIEKNWFKDNTSIWHMTNSYMETPKFTKPSDEELKKMLTPLQYTVTQEDGTEPAFKNEYWDNKEAGIYVDLVSGEPLFSSLDKYKSGTGWPSFTKPLVEENVVQKKDFKMILPRTEIRSKTGNNHIGHLFNDGPEPSGKRFCMNSAAMRFIPADKLEEEGYEEFVVLFES